MKTASACPATDELRQLLDGSLSGERQQECTSHMDSCQGCVSRLEAIAAGGTDISQVVERLHETQPVPNSAYWPAVQALDGRLGALLDELTTFVKARKP